MIVSIYIYVNDCIYIYILVWFFLFLIISTVIISGFEPAWLTVTTHHRDFVRQMTMSQVDAALAEQQRELPLGRSMRVAYDASVSQLWAAPAARCQGVLVWCSEFWWKKSVEGGVKESESDGFETYVEAWKTTSCGLGHCHFFCWKCRLPGGRCFFCHWGIWSVIRVDILILSIIY